MNANTPTRPVCYWVERSVAHGSRVVLSIETIASGKVTDHLITTWLDYVSAARTAERLNRAQGLDHPIYG